MTEIFFSVVDVFMDQDEVQIFSHASIISNEKKPRVSYFAVAPFLFSFFLPNKECEPPLYFTNADEEAGVMRTQPVSNWGEWERRRNLLRFISLASRVDTPSSFIFHSRNNTIAVLLNNFTASCSPTNLNLGCVEVILTGGPGGPATPGGPSGPVSP